jgi:hypothetical protein
MPPKWAKNIPSKAMTGRKPKSVQEREYKLQLEQNQNRNQNRVVPPPKRNFDL